MSSNWFDRRVRRVPTTKSFSRKDVSFRVKLSRKEVKESRYRLNLRFTHDVAELEQRRTELVREAMELMNIFGAILRNSPVD